MREEALEGEFGKREMRRAMLLSELQKFAERHRGASANRQGIVVIQDNAGALIRLFPLVPAQKRWDRRGGPDRNEAQI